MSEHVFMFFILSRNKLQKARERAEGENETLRQTTEQLENRILDEKLKSVEELNKMNAANENLRQQLDKSIGNKAQKSRVRSYLFIRCNRT